jgi:hypothetical protein
LRSADRNDGIDLAGPFVTAPDPRPNGNPTVVRALS